MLYSIVIFNDSQQKARICFVHIRATVNIRFKLSLFNLRRRLASN